MLDSSDCKRRASADVALQRAPECAPEIAADKVGGVFHMVRPEAVPGPDGAMITLDDLPSHDTRRWVVRRKAEVLAAINGGMLSASEACARYRISPEELQLWQDAVERAGVPGLRVTRIQLYRDDFASIGVRGRRAGDDTMARDGWR